MCTADLFLSQLPWPAALEIQYFNCTTSFLCRKELGKAYSVCVYFRTLLLLEQKNFPLLGSLVPTQSLVITGRSAAFSFFPPFLPPSDFKISSFL